MADLRIAAQSTPQFPNDPAFQASRLYSQAPAAEVLNVLWSTILTSKPNAFPLPLALFKRRTIWVPTLLAWSCFLTAIALFITTWFFEAESYLSRTNRVPAEVLVVEGWIGPIGIRAAKTEFDRGSYRYVVVTSGLSGEPWDTQRWEYSVVAEHQLLQMGIPVERIVRATPRNTERQRTFESAAAVARALKERGLRPTSINVFTRFVHARRSRLVYAKVLGNCNVGVIGWLPPGTGSIKWWNDSDRADDLMKESIGFIFEALFNSGRRSNSSSGPS